MGWPDDQHASLFLRHGRAGCLSLLAAPWVDLLRRAFLGMWMWTWLWILKVHENGY